MKMGAMRSHGARATNNNSNNATIMATVAAALVVATTTTVGMRGCRRWESKKRAVAAVSQATYLQMVPTRTWGTS